MAHVIVNLTFSSLSTSRRGNQVNCVNHYINPITLSWIAKTFWKAISQTDSKRKSAQTFAEANFRIDPRLIRSGPPRGHKRDSQHGNGKMNDYIMALNNLKNIIAGLHSTEVAFLPLAQGSLVRLLAFPKNLFQCSWDLSRELVRGKWTEPW